MKTILSIKYFKKCYGEPLFSEPESRSAQSDPDNRAADSSAIATNGPCVWDRRLLLLKLELPLSFLEDRGGAWGRDSGRLARL